MKEKNPVLNTIAGGAIAGHPVSQGAGEVIALVFIALILVGLVRLLTRARS